MIEQHNFLGQALGVMEQEGLEVTVESGLSLRVGSGSLHRTEGESTLIMSAAISLTVSSDTQLPKQCNVALVDVSGVLDVWVDSFVDDGFHTQADPPRPNVADIARFVLPAGATDWSGIPVSVRRYIRPTD